MDVQRVDLLAAEPPEVGDGQRHRHRASVQVIGVEISDVRGRSARVAVGDVGVVGDGVPPGDHRDAAANPALDEQMHVDVREQFQLHLGHLQHGVPAEAQRGVIVCRMEAVMCHIRGAELLEDVGEQKNVGEQVQVEVLCKRRHVEGGPHLLGVGVIGVADIGLCEAAVEGRLGRQLRLLQSCGPVEVVVREDPFRFNSSVWSVWASRLTNPSLGRLATSFSSEADINWRLSTKRSLPSENEMYFVMLFAMTLMRPGWRPSAGAMRWASYPRRLCMTTGTSTLDPPFAFFPLKYSRRLHLLCAAPDALRSGGRGRGPSAWRPSRKCGRWWPRRSPRCRRASSPSGRDSRLRRC